MVCSYERPSRHIAIEIVEVRIVFYRLETRRPIIYFCQHLGERGLTASDISCNSYIHVVIEIGYSFTFLHLNSFCFYLSLQHNRLVYCCVVCFWEYIINQNGICIIKGWPLFQSHPYDDLLVVKKNAVLFTSMVISCLLLRLSCFLSRSACRRLFFANRSRIACQCEVELFLFEVGLCYLDADFIT